MRHLFTKRQLMMLDSLCGLVTEAHQQVVQDSNGNSVYATAVVAYLGESVSKLTCFHNTLAYWRAKETKCASGMGRQAIPMTWDYAETNPFGEAAGDFEEIVTKAAPKVVASLPAVEKPGIVFQRDAVADWKPHYPVVISTDPPYYDNISYADLSDYFYVWLRRSMERFFPELFSTMLTPKTDELIACAYRHLGGNSTAKEFFENRLGLAFKQMRRIQDTRFPLTVFYAFKQSEDEGENIEQEDSTEDQSTLASTGWETMLEGLLRAGFMVEGTWPMRTEQSKALKDTVNVLASSIVLVCRSRPEDAGVASRRDFLSALKRELPESLRNLQKGNIAPVDLAQAAIGPGMAVFSRYARVLEADGAPMSVRTALSLINNALDEVLAEQEGEFDADTRWAVAWFDQNGFNEGPYGVAETLSTAKNTSVSGMVEAGILTAKGGKVRLLKKEELQENWDPAADKRLTVWEATHHLIRSLDKGESVTATLVKKLGAIGESARDLSYRLYTVCERRKWSQEAIGYNALVLSWPDLKRLAAEQESAGPVQRELI